MDPYHEERLRNEVFYLHSLYDEERLTNEVLYLHSLWHQGPPNPRPFHIPYNPRPYSLIHQSSVNLNPRPPYPFVPNHPRPLQPVHSSSFKNKKRKKKKPTKKRDGRKRTRVDPHLNSDSEWPMPTQDSAPVVSGWPPMEPRPAQVTPPLSAEDKEKLQALQVQYKARQACREFLFDYDDSDDEADEDDVEDDEDSFDDDDDEAEEIAEFFSKLFGENNELRNYYHKCWERGEFRCLVCGLADNKNAGKRFHDCVGLVQHSMSISRTKNRRAHRAFGNAVCNVLGWDINRLPTIVIKNDVKPAEAEGKTNDNTAEGKDGSLFPDKLDEASVEHLGEPVKQDVEVVHETIKRVSEMFSPTQDSAPVDSEWPPLEPPPTHVTRPLSAEEKEILEVLQVQYKARRACQEFLLSSDYSNDGCDDDDDEDDMDDDDELEEMRDFFLKLFGENNELWKYYEKCWEHGEFRCLVCGVANNKNVGKRFLDCVSLVQHSMLISRTKNRRAHRAFGNAVCNVLGWDINRLPTIVIRKEVKPPETEGKTDVNAADGEDGSLSYKLDEVSGGQLGEPVKQNVEVVYETIKRVSELLAPTQDSAPEDAAWPPLEPCPTQATHPLSAEEKETLEVLQVQYKARQACREFLFGSDDSDDGGDDDEEDNMDNDDPDDDELKEMGDFFLKLFGENNELRKYYEKCWEHGEFRCLVCGVADNKNAGKRFHDCVGLVQHSMSISRTKKKRAHRAFGNALCNVLGWDINRLPTIVVKNEVRPAEAKVVNLLELNYAYLLQGKTNENDDGKVGSVSSDKLDYKASVEQLCEPVKQGVEVVRETIKQVEPDKSADDQVNRASSQNFEEDHDVPH
ncbi:hypothetical protein QN277_008836 [Acacia crassicarpa]|uniref:Uncharacterized protein n=1 Tax=Acacia crassicarpa TaxID=499986 RepID=A0AAE1ISQ9_9FABA|nr:hypothetical protein QN277_008836 [Acacia crassicarpa]